MTKVIKVPESHLEVIPSPQQESQPTALSQLKYAEPTELYLRDGEVVIHRRPGSPLWHCRFRLQDGSWHRQTTRQASIEHAVRMACDLYDETRFRQKMNHYFEEMILSKPHQYMWSYNHYKRPVGAEMAPIE